MNTNRWLIVTLGSLNGMYDLAVAHDYKIITAAYAAITQITLLIILARLERR